MALVCGQTHREGAAGAWNRKYPAAPQRQASLVPAAALTTSAEPSGLQPLLTQRNSQLSEWALGLT